MTENGKKIQVCIGSAPVSFGFQLTTDTRRALWLEKWQWRWRVGVVAWGVEPPLRGGGDAQGGDAQQRNDFGALSSRQRARAVPLRVVLRATPTP